MAPKELETTTIELADGRYELRASATKVLFDGFSIVYTEGRDDASADDEDEAGARLPNLAEGDVTDVTDVTPTQHFTEPPPRFTEATLIKALEEHGIGRPSTYAATISTIIDRGYVRVEDRRLHPEPVAEIVTDFLVEHFGDYVDVEFTARMEEELDEVANGERPWVPLLRAFYDQLKDDIDKEPRSAAAGRDRRGLLARPPDGHPARAERAVPGLFALSGAQGDPAAPGRRATARRRARARSAPSAARARWSASGAVRPVRRLLALSGLQVHQEGRPATARSAAVRGHLPEEPRRPPRPASRATDRERLLGVLELPALRLHDEQRATGRLPRHGRRSARTQGRGGDLPGVRLDERGGSRCRSCPGERYPGGPPNPEALARPARGRAGGRAGGGKSPAKGRGRHAAGAAPPGPPERPTTSATHESSEHDRPSRPPTRERGVGRLGDRPRAGALPPLPRRARRLTAHPACLCDRGRRLPRLAGGARDRLAPPGPGRPARLSRGARGRPRALVGRAAAGRDPVVPPLGHPRRPRAGRSVGRHRDAAAAASSPARPRGRAGRPAARRGGRRPRRATR